MEHNNSYSCLCSSGFTDYNCLSSVDVQIEALKSSNEGRKRFLEYFYIIM